MSDRCDLFDIVLNQNNRFIKKMSSYIELIRDIKNRPHYIVLLLFYTLLI
jgi:hypothetical protein